MAVKYAPSKLSIPPGFQNLLEGLAREVLREQPENIVNFSAQYFRNQVLLRKDAQRDQAEVAHHSKSSSPPFKEGSEESQVKDADPTYASDADTEAAAVKIQAAFRGHKERKSLKENRLEGGKDAKESDQSYKVDEQPTQAEALEKETSPQEVSVDTDDPALTAAAVKIQSSFRGHQVRKEFKTRQPAESSPTSDASPSSDETVIKPASTQEGEPEPDAAAQESAALLIQSSYRGHRVRKELEASRSRKQSSQSNATGESCEDVVNVAAEDDVENTAEAEVDQDIPTEPAQTPEVDYTNLEDEATTRAAVKIQASYRGHQVRRNMKAKPRKASGDEDEPSVDAAKDEPSTDAAIDEPSTEAATDEPTTDAAIDEPSTDAANDGN